jgi:chemotaxis protein MotB
MYPLGSAEMMEPAKKLISLVTQVIQKLPNKISITGHTDSTQYAFTAKYTNWELSADRANASRREFVADGLPASRIDRVGGVADQDPLDKDNPGAPQNRRISVVLLRGATDKTDIKIDTKDDLRSVKNETPVVTPLPREQQP